ncbi:BA75_01905T0 [Komagataella pastoris]|uniref:[RNA-polymerase]-subunit kinase n=1 Tax=Komagataella pastoris TaxID=4922 RepID=A0A1B2JCN9_PICPA|nr:BA75_01905T0 [Komagataella pastoris]
MTISYTKEKKVGEGTYAVVYLGKQMPSERKIAVKEIKVGAFKDGVDMSAIREVKYLQELKHQNVIELVDVFDEEGNINLVLEFLPMDLEIIIKDTSLLFQPGDVKSWMLMTLRGLHHCHRNSILHRDLKPNNLLISPDGELKIADFGLARSLSQPNERLTSNVVTRWYRAPELLFGARHYTEVIDVWAVGIIFAELMLRTPYLPGKDDADQLTVTFQALGTPTEKTWPGVSALPLYKSLHVYPEPSRAELLNRFGAASEEALNLMIAMTRMDPNKRCTTEEALVCKYFTEFPPPTKPMNLPMRTQKKRESEEDYESNKR